MEDAWSEVGERFAALGRRLRDGDVDREAVDQALESLAAAVDDVVDAVAGPLRDPSFKEEAREAARSLGHAITSTVRDLFR
ncbi:MAG TPA: hypothetical protein VHF47_01665 [Acidimicrobiales bacterium]|nr:hypothetical protein [Acidimicrobiales bacterium]